MKRLILLSSIFISSVTYSQSTIRFGLEAGSNMTLPETALNIQSQRGFGFWAGAMVEAHLKNTSDNFKLQFEALYNQLRIKFNPPSDVYWMKFQQINMPLAAKYYFSKHFSINAGPTFNFNIAAKQKIDLGDRIIDTSIQRGDLTTIQIGATVGLNYHFGNGIFITARYNPMFTPVLQSQLNNPDLYRPKIHSIQLGIGFLFDSFSPDVPDSGD